VILVFSSAWGGASNKNYKSLLGARIFQGIGLAPFEALVNASVGDLYHVHQRGKRMALSNLALFGGAFFTPVLVGKIAHSMEWQWTFYFVAIFSGVLLPVVIFFVPETAFRRDAHFNTDTATTKLEHRGMESGVELDQNGRHSQGTGPESPRDSQQPINGRDEKPEGEANVQGVRDAEQGPTPVKSSWKNSLMPFNGRKTDERYLRLLLRPFPLFLHPGILWVSGFSLKFLHSKYLDLSSY